MWERGAGGGGMSCFILELPQDLKYNECLIIVPTLKVLKCEIFSLRFSLFFTMEPLWIGNFKTEIKKSKIFCFLHYFQVFFAKILFLRIILMSNR